MGGEWVALITALFSGGVGVAVVGFFRDRRKSNAEGRVAEQTVELRVDADRLENLEHRLDFTVKAFDLERASLNNQLRALSKENERLTTELAHRDLKIAELEARLEKVQTELHSLSDELAKLRAPLTD